MARQTLDALFKRVNKKNAVEVKEEASFHLPCEEDSTNRFLKEVGTYVAKLRMGKGLNQSELGEEAGIQQPYISMIENGRLNCRVRSLVKILSVLDADIEIRVIPHKK